MLKPLLLASALILTTPLAAAAPVVPPLQYVQRTLPNGLRVFAMPDAGGTTVSVQVWYNVGGRDDPRGRSGFAHLFEHLMFKATRDMAPEQMMRLTEDVGGDINASTDDDFTEYHEVAPANHLERLLWAEAERMGSLVIDQATFAAERDVVKEELRGDAARPYDSLFRLDLPAASYTTASYARSPIGSIADLDAATLADVRAFHADYYRPDNAILVVSGNFDPKQLDAWVDHYFAPIAKPAWPIPRADPAEPPRTAARRYTVHAVNTPLPAVLLSWPLPPATDPDHAAIDVLDGILSSGESSRLYQSLVYRDRIAGETGVMADLRKGTGMITAYALLTGGKTVAEAEAALRREIGRLRDEPVAAEELTRVKNQIITGALKARETAEGRAGTLASDVILENDPNASDRRIAAIEAITPADVQRAARRLLADDRAIVIADLPATGDVVDQTIAVASTVRTAPLIVPPNAPVPVQAAAADRIQPPAPGQPVTPALPVPVERKLANGMKLVVVERHAVPIVTAFLVARGGSSSDPQARAGLAELTADVLTKGTATRSATDIARTIETLGGGIGADATRDGMFLQLTVRTEALAPALRVFADVATAPAFPQAEIERERAKLIDGLSIEYTTPGSLASMVAARALYGDGPYGKPANGTPLSLKRIAHDDMAAGYRAWWRPDAVTLVMVGDITPDHAAAEAESLFGGWHAPATAVPAAPAAAALPAPRTIVVDLARTPQAAVWLARPTIARIDPRYYAMTVANAALGGGFGSRLNQEVRVKRGLAYGASSSFQARRMAGPLTVATQTKNTTVPQVVTLMRGEMARMGSELVPTAELEARKATLIGGFGRATETTDGLAGLTAGLVLEGAPLSEIARYAPSVAAVTAEQVRAVAVDLIDPKAASTIIVGDAGQFLPALKAAGVTPEVIPAATLNLDSATLR
ncbi:M16 family metallopeptidase [Sphingomonas nostoxanthinifaciens]|uniref:M16 family metallopeptidase n=1 Tax=Sphingomonas nostoxanthinifaciens TaxID=2872652 RepID=UPI001CC1E074|nr:pitrilysin family protein [Sphingomonas nostoxanthinifaciens]UAK25098.1 insulinase family protein [Sphingomonas nostoxanthinifaciens]